MEINEILESVKSGKISTSNAKKLLTLYSIEEVEGIAKIDINRRKRRGVPEVIFAETKELEDIKKSKRYKPEGGQETIYKVSNPYPIQDTPQQDTFNIQRNNK